ncbi:MAG: hypothetical protein RJA07_326 [Bacteroidota bacterium]|jgi:hypothetical protein
MFGCGKYGTGLNVIYFLNISVEVINKFLIALLKNQNHLTTYL